MKYRIYGNSNKGWILINETDKQEEIENEDMYDGLLCYSSKYFYCLSCNKKIGLVEKVD